MKDLLEIPIGFKLLGLVVMGLVIVISSCSKDCESIHYSDQKIDDISKEFRSWENKDSLFYIDKDGNEYIYAKFFYLESNENYKSFGFCKNDRNYIAFNTERRSTRYTNINKTSIAFVQRVNFVMEETSYEEINLVDRMTASIYNDSLLIIEPISRMYLVTSEKVSDYDKDIINSEFVTLLDSFSLFNKKFYNVMKSNAHQAKLYYTKEEGVISFTDNNGTKLVLSHWN